MESILYAQLPDEVLVIRVIGRGNHQNSLALKEAVAANTNAGRPPRCIIDLGECPTMDSTFMGVLAGIAIRQQKTLGTKVIIVNAQEHTRSLLQNLGLKFILDIRVPGDRAGVPESEAHKFSPVAEPEADKIERIVLMIEAHEKLIDASGENEAQFKGVLQSLKDSLDRARGNPS